MAIFNGTIQHNSLEGGFFELHCDDGKTYRLQGGPEVTAGDKVAVQGTEQAGGFGIQMSGPAIEVDKIQPQG